MTAWFEIKRREVKPSQYILLLQICSVSYNRQVEELWERNQNRKRQQRLHQQDESKEEK